MILPGLPHQPSEKTGKALRQPAINATQRITLHVAFNLIKQLNVAIIVPL